MAISAILTANSLIRHGDLYPERTPNYAIALWLGGAVGLFFDSLIGSGIIYFFLRSRLAGVRFVSFYLGFLLFRIPEIAAVLINVLFFPILIAVKGSTGYSVYSIFSARHLFNVSSQGFPITLIGIFDLVAILQILAHAMFVSLVSKARFWYVLVLVAATELILLFFASLMPI
jgi:hypothetical protein